MGRSWLRVGVPMLVFVALLIGSVFAGTDSRETVYLPLEKKEKINVDKIKEIVRDIEEIHCKMTEAELLSQKLTKGDIRKVREFCSLPTAEKGKILREKFSKIKEKKSCNGKNVNRSNSYSCWYIGYNTGIPEYEDLGLSSSTCSWHDPNPDCKVEGAVACLWGCTNPDPALGWHIKEFSSVSELENEITPKGYHKVADYYGGDYRRWLDYGYSYQVHYWGDFDNDGKPEYHSEGPEPSPEFNWYAFLRDWWPEEVYVWHDNC